MEKQGILIVISGFSGVGKGTLVKKMLEKYDNYALSVSATSRLPRNEEKEGVSYFFKTKEEFEDMIAKDAFLEYARYVDNYYGTPKAYVEQKLAEGKDVILEIEIQGAMKVKEKFPNTLLLFVVPPNAETLRNRLVGRGTESEDVIESRLSRAVEEAEGMDDYDYLVVNDDLDICAAETHRIIQSEHFRANRNINYMNQLREELQEFSKGE